MTTQTTTDIQAFINRHPFSKYQWMILVLCFVTVAMDGFDTAIIGFIASDLIQEWGVQKSDLGPVMSAALVGLAVGALTAGPMADRIGRKKVLVLSILVFGGFSLITAFATSLTQLTVLRFLTGLGLGAAMPNAATLMSEYAPERRRALLILLTIVIVVGIAWTAYYLLVARWQQDTDDAYVQGNVVSITPQTMGTVVAINADDGMRVQAGQVLVQLDPNDAKVALEQAQANLAATVRQVRWNAAKPTRAKPNARCSKRWRARRGWWCCTKKAWRRRSRRCRWPIRWRRPIRSGRWRCRCRSPPWTRSWWGCPTRRTGTGRP